MQKSRPVPVTTIARTAESESAATNASASSVRVVRSIMLRDLGPVQPDPLHGTVAFDDEVL